MCFSQNHEKVLALMTSMMSQVVHQVNRPGSLRSRLQELADIITSQYRGQQINSSPDTASIFFLLRDLLVFFDQYHAQEYHQALEVSSLVCLIQHWNNSLITVWLIVTFRITTIIQFSESTFYTWCKSCLL
jgi:Nup93/Nic96.